MVDETVLADEGQSAQVVGCLFAIAGLNAGAQEFALPNQTPAAGNLETCKEEREAK